MAGHTAAPAPASRTPKPLEMALKLVALLALVAAASAQYYQAESSVVKQHVFPKTAHGNDPHPQYKYAYDVKDSLSGDSKSQVEERDGDVVRGEYSLIDADGFKRTVTYTADSINGFRAVVHREPLVKAVAAPAPARVTHYTAPSVLKSHAPVYASNAAPSVHLAQHY